MNESLTVFLSGNEPFVKKDPILAKLIEALIGIGAKPHLYINSQRMTDETPFHFSAKIRLLENAKYVDGSYGSFCGNADTALNAVDIAAESLIKRPHIAVENEEGKLQQYVFDSVTCMFTAVGEPVVELD